MNIHSLLAQTYDYTPYSTTPSTDAAASSGATAIFWILYLGLLVLVFVSMAVIFKKAGQKWWKAIIPIYNVYVLLKIIGRPGWWLILYFIPFVNLVISIINSVDLAKKFGHGIGTALGLIFIPFIMYPVIAFSPKYQYKGAQANTPNTIADTPYPTSSSNSDTTGPQPPTHTEPAPGAPEPPSSTPPENPTH